MYCVCVDNMLYYRKKERNQEFMAKTGNLYARIEPDVKEQAEEILSTLGISVSSAINMFYAAWDSLLHDTAGYESYDASGTGHGT